MPNLFNLPDLDASGIPDMAGVAEASGHTAPDMTSLTGEDVAGAEPLDVPTMGCGNGVVPAAGIPAEIRDVLAAHQLERMQSASGYGLWELLRRAGQMPQVAAIQHGFGPVS